MNGHESTQSTSIGLESPSSLCSERAQVFVYRRGSLAGSFILPSVPHHAFPPCEARIIIYEAATSS
jgi:hypothetical protein